MSMPALLEEYYALGNRLRQLPQWAAKLMERLVDETLREQDRRTGQLVEDAQTAIRTSEGVRRLKADREEAKHFAAALYAITNKRPDLSTVERAELATAIVDCQRARNLID